jgi:hypothetical protein
VPFVQDKVDAAGALADDHSRRKIRELLEALAALARKLNPAGRP